MAGRNRPTVAIETHGCKLNQADSAILASSFAEAGFSIVGEDGPADIYLVNTCTVTHVADSKARQALRAARRRSPNATIIATGCYAQRAPEALRSIPEVDLVWGNADKPDLVRRVVESRRAVIGPPSDGGVAQRTRSTIGRTRAMVKIQEGCDQVCAYCIVPKVRGRERSIPAREIVSRINEYVSQGCREVVLTGTQLGSYGFDLPDMDLSGLLALILRETDVPRLRVSSIQPQEISRRLLDAWSDPRLCPHFHLALQSGSDAVLKRMRRRYTAAQYAAAAELVRQAVPGVSVTTDVIVGFPGETDADFGETYALCEAMGFAAIHVFPFSARPGTSAAHFDVTVDHQAKAQRMQMLLALSRRSSAEFRERLIGATRQVLWEGPWTGEGRDWWVGLTDNYIRVVAPSPRSLANEITRTRLRRRRDDLVISQVL